MLKEKQKQKHVNTKTFLVLNSLIIKMTNLIFRDINFYLFQITNEVVLIEVLRLYLKVFFNSNVNKVNFLLL